MDSKIIGVHVRSSEDESFTHLDSGVRLRSQNVQEHVPDLPPNFLQDSFETRGGGSRTMWTPKTRLHHQTRLEST